MPTWVPYPDFVNPGDNAWQLTAATLVGLMSVPGLAVLYGGVMQKRWSVNSMMMTFVAFALVLVVWVLYGFKMAFGAPMHIFGADTGFFSTMWGTPHSVLSTASEQSQALIPRITTGPAFNFSQPTLVYFQFVFAAITPILMLGSVLGRFNFRAWIPFVILWSSTVYTVNAFLIWGGGFWATHGALDFSGGYVIHLAAGVSGFVAAAVIGPRLQRDREIDAPNNLLMVATGAGLLWLGWNGFNGGDPYYAGANASLAVLNTNLAAAVAFLSWIALDYATGHKPSLISSVNGMITGLVVITPCAGFINGWGALCIGLIGGTLCYFALNYLSRMRPFRNVDDTLGVIYTHGFAGLFGGLLLGFFADPEHHRLRRDRWWSHGPAGLLQRVQRRQLGAPQGRGRDRPLGDPVLRNRHVHPAEDRGAVRVASHGGGRHGGRRHRRARSRGLSLGRAVAGLPVRSAERASARRYGKSGTLIRRPRRKVGAAVFLVPVYDW